MNNQPPTAPPIRSSDGFPDSPTWPHVLKFALRMEAKLEKNRHKGNREGWLQDDADELLERLRQELIELDTAMCIAVGRMTEGESNARWAAENVANEAADVANFALFLADWHLSRAQESGNAKASDHADSERGA